MAKPAAAPTAPTAMFWLHDMRAAAPVKEAVGAGEVKVPLVADGITPVETAVVVGTWIWPSWIWVTGAGAEVGAWIWPSWIWVTGEEPRSVLEPGHQRFVDLAVSNLGGLLRNGVDSGGQGQDKDLLHGRHCI